MKPSRLLHTALIALMLSGTALAPALAQEAPAPKPQDETAALFDDINDIDKLRVLNPLKLTADQLDKIVKLLQEQQKAYNQRLQDAAVTPLRPIASEIAETRRKLLAGGPVPSGFDDKVKQLQSDFLDKRKKEDATTLATVSAGIRNILTQDQIDVAVGTARNLTKKAGQDTLKGDDAAFFNYYVVGTFLSYPRIVPLLQDMRKAVGTTQTGRAGGPVREARR